VNEEAVAHWWLLNKNIKNGVKFSWLLMRQVTEAGVSKQLPIIMG
jgi:hypothetical protein